MNEKSSLTRYLVAGAAFVIVIAGVRAASSLIVPEIPSQTPLREYPIRIHLHTRPLATPNSSVV